MTIQLNEQRKKQLAYIGITDEDLAYLHGKRELFEQITSQVVDQLYEQVVAVPELSAIIRQHSTLDRLKETQRWYFMSLTNGVIDEAFIERRILIGNIHSRIGLTTDWYLGTYMLYLDTAVQHFKRIAPDSWMTIILALSKMFNLDSQLVLEAYEKDEKDKIQALSDAKQTTLTTISRIVQELSAMIVELSSSSQSVADSATHTADIQDQANVKVRELQSKIGEIDGIGSLLQEISDQSQLLGINAAIEAAHAADHGRGFGIVANEIRKLASHSKESLVTVREKLQEITGVIGEVMQDAERTSTLARDQAASSQELTSFVQMIETITLELESIQ
ncbi:globin-coupled sensor protein [Paenibacillus sacheonensis]|uniref:Chemotaxis protein n=1 Tax=Paenibacillus sacheonensis TaxID=742054 RepID=A0A7X4YQI2_9BACL|nr:globin-coupled sensor protein [Paenibacillus sacheonensis]MBM7566698.1 heme-based aerotactic transducer [Paenibacillus sacheonensis]NBC70677.1 chemotaxis protein [Paenibacillus sacheonensis]